MMSTGAHVMLTELELLVYYPNMVKFVPTHARYTRAFEYGE